MSSLPGKKLPPDELEVPTGSDGTVVPPEAVLRQATAQDVHQGPIYFRVLPEIMRSPILVLRYPVRGQTGR